MIVLVVLLLCFTLLTVVILLVMYAHMSFTLGYLCFVLDTYVCISDKLDLSLAPPSTQQQQQTSYDTDYERSLPVDERRQLQMSRQTHMQQTNRRRAAREDDDAERYAWNDQSQQQNNMPLDSNTVSLQYASLPGKRSRTICFSLSYSLFDFLTVCLTLSMNFLTVLNTHFFVCLFFCVYVCYVFFDLMHTGKGIKWKLAHHHKITITIDNISIINHLHAYSIPYAALVQVIETKDYRHNAASSC